MRLVDLIVSGKRSQENVGQSQLPQPGRIVQPDAALLLPAPPQGESEEEYKAYNEKGVVDSWVSSFGNKAMAYSGGFEYVYDEQFAVRAGYYTDSRNLGKRSYFTTGFGITYHVLGINFSYLVPAGRGVDVNPLSNTMQFSVLLYPGMTK